MYDDGSSLVHLFDRFKCILMYFGWVDYVILFHCADIKGVFRSESIVYYRCGGCMLYSAVTSSILAIAFFPFIIVFVGDAIIFFVC